MRQTVLAEIHCLLKREYEIVEYFDPVLWALNVRKRERRLHFVSRNWS